MKATDATPDLFVCDCGSNMWANCGITGGQQMNETLLTCPDCKGEKVVSNEEYEAAKAQE